MKKKYIKPKSIEVRLDPEEVMLQQLLTLSGGEQGQAGDHAEAKFDDWEDDPYSWSAW